jgi:hypothetical protein
MGRQRSAGSDVALKLGGLAASVGKGLAAGLVGTAAMTVSITAEAKLRGRERSTIPARAASKVLGVAPVDEIGERRFNALVHWGYGMAWGSVRGLLGAAGIGVSARRSPTWRRYGVASRSCSRQRGRARVQPNGMPVRW